MKFAARFIRFFLTAAVAFTAAACSDSADDDHGGGDKPGTAPDRSLRATAVNRLEVPMRLGSNLFVSHWTVENGDSVMSYCYEFDRAKYHTRWVAYRFDAVTRQNKTGRSDAWSDDPGLPASLRIGTNGFSGYDRGHICPSADRLYSQAANAQTFYMSNMSPQLGRGFNQSMWADFENFVRGFSGAKFADTLYVVKGGTIDRLNGYVSRPKGMQVAVPKYYFCALLGVKGGAYKAVGYLFEHRNYGSAEIQTAKSGSYADYAMCIDELENATGIDFFHNLPDVVEQRVESSYTPSAWR